MNPTYLIGWIHIRRGFFKVNKVIQNTIYWSSSSSSSSSSGSSSSDDERKIEKLKNENQKKNEEALNKLNYLLKTMIEEDTVASKSKLELAKPPNKRKNKFKNDEVESSKEQSPEKQMVTAVKNVAEVIGGNTKQTESELLMKLLSTSESKSNNLSDLVKGMQVDLGNNDQSRAQQVKQILESIEKSKSLDGQRPKPMRTKTRSDIPLEKINLFGSEPLGIFTDLPNSVTEGVENKTWSKLHERDLKLAVTHPPNNYFQQMILWTEQGKVWKFPIDNEQGLEEEKNVYFTEHVFLEQHLEPWCPARGPLRHFMELVCVGLSKNPYLTVEMKKEHINWFKNYFEDKKQLLKEVGALQDIELGKTRKPKQIE